MIPFKRRKKGVKLLREQNTKIIKYNFVFNEEMKNYYKSFLYKNKNFKKINKFVFYLFENFFKMASLRCVIWWETELDINNWEIKKIWHFSRNFFLLSSTFRPTVVDVIWPKLFFMIFLSILSEDCAKFV
jgi:hypothetical protein